MRALKERLSGKHEEKKKVKVGTVVKANVPAPPPDVPVNKEVREMQVTKVRNFNELCSFRLFRSKSFSKASSTDLHNNGLSPNVSHCFPSPNSLNFATVHVKHSGCNP
jgi:hypothetical protein